MPDIILVLDNIRSIHNVGSLLRVSDGLGVKQVIACGMSPHLTQPDDPRLPHVIARAEKELKKTALGAEESVDFSYENSTLTVVERLKSEGWYVICLEQTKNSHPLKNFKTDQTKIALVLGHEIDGVKEEVCEVADVTLEIEMNGIKNSLNVATAGAIAIYQIINFPQLG